MRRFSLVVCTIVFALATHGAPPQDQVVSGHLSGSQVPGGGDPDGSAVVSLVFSEDSQTFAWSASVEDIALPAQLTIHIAPHGYPLAGALSLIDPVTISEPFNGGTITGFNLNVLEGIEGAMALITNAEFPDGALQGALSSPRRPGQWVLPVVGSVEGGGGTFFTTDLRLLSRVTHSNTATNVILEFHPRGATGTEPAHTATVSLDPGEVAVLDDLMKEQFGLDDALGALVVRSDIDVIPTARVFNDARASGDGTFGQFVNAMGTNVGAWREGVLPHLYNVPLATGDGHRTNVGWFNASDRPAYLEMKALGPGPQFLGSFKREIPAGAHEHLAIQGLIPNTAEAGDFYIVYEVRNADLSHETLEFYPYASVTDNVNGDAIFVTPMNY